MWYRSVQRWVPAVLLLVFTLAISGCGQIGKTSQAIKKGSLVLKFTIPGEVSTQSLRSPIATYEVTFNGATTKTETFTNDGNPMVVELQEGTWDVTVTAIDERGTRAYEGSQYGVVVNAGAITDAAINLTPKPAIVTMVADVSALSNAGYSPYSVYVYWSGRGYSNSDYFYASSYPTMMTRSINAPGTYDFKFQARTTSNGVIAEKVLTDYQLWPGEEITITWVADTPTSNSGSISITGTVVTPIDTPTNFNATWNTATNMLDMSWTAPADAPMSAWYKVEAQVDTKQAYGLVQGSTSYPYDYWEFNNTTGVARSVPSSWRGKTVKLRMYVYGSNTDGLGRYSVATDPISVVIPATP